MKQRVLRGALFAPALQDNTVCLSVLALSAAQQQSYHTGKQAPVITYSLIGEAMKALRERFLSQSDLATDWTIVAATLLWALNSFVGDAAAFESHSRSVYALIDARGGLQKLGMSTVLAAMVRWVDIWNAIACIVKCRFKETATLFPISWPIPRTAGSYFESDRCHINFHPSISATCKEVCHSLEAVEEWGTTPPSGLHYTIVVSRIASHYSTLASLAVDHQGDHNAKSQCVIYSTLALIMMLFHPVESHHLIMTIVSRRLAKAIQLASWEDDLDLFVWVLVVSQMIPFDFEGKDQGPRILCGVLDRKFSQSEEGNCVASRERSNENKNGNEKDLTSSSDVVEETISEKDENRWPKDWRARLENTLRQFVWWWARSLKDLARICDGVERERPLLDGDGEWEDDKKADEDGLDDEA